MKRALFAPALLLLAVCGGPEVPPPPGPPKAPLSLPPPSDEVERTSILNLGYGSTVVSRTGEEVLETSAICAIDGDPSTAWQTPPKDFPQSMVIALAAPARIDRVGVRTSKTLYASKVVFETSADGRTFAPLATVAPKADTDPQWFDVPPADAAYVRVTIPVAGADVLGGRLVSVLARGRELAPARPRSIDGCWQVNGRAAAFRSHGAHTTGTMTYARSTMSLDGGSDGRLYRFEWIKGAEWGYAAFTVAPDEGHLNGIQWHEEPIAAFFGDAWFGDKAECHSERSDVVTPASSPADRAASSPPARAGGEDAAGSAGGDAGVTRDPSVAHALLQRAGRHSLYDLRFGSDGKLDAAASAEGLASLAGLLAEHPDARLVAHEFREKTAADNRARCQRELDSLREHLQNGRIELSRVTFVAAGSDQPRQIPGSEAARELYSTVDIEVRR